MNTNNVSFKGVFGIYGKPETIKSVGQKLNSVKNTYMTQATDLYKNRAGEGILTQVSKQGKDVAIIVTGKEDIQKVSTMERGWSSINSLSNHLKEIVNVDNYDLPSFMTQIRQLAQKENTSELVAKFSKEV